MIRHFQKPCATIRDILDGLAASTRPAGLVVFEVRQRKVCKPLDKMCHRGRAFYYGLARMQADKAEVLNPDCEKDWPAAKLPGEGGRIRTCTFSDCASLERAP
jgi:hypothetical protein